MIASVDPSRAAARLIARFIFASLSPHTLLPSMRRYFKRNVRFGLASKLPQRSMFGADAVERSGVGLSPLDSLPARAKRVAANRIKRDCLPDPKFYPAGVWKGKSITRLHLQCVFGCTQVVITGDECLPFATLCGGRREPDQF